MYVSGTGIINLRTLYFHRYVLPQETLHIIPYEFTYQQCYNISVYHVRYIIL